MHLFINKPLFSSAHAFHIKKNCTISNQFLKDFFIPKLATSTATGTTTTTTKPPTWAFSKPRHTTTTAGTTSVDPSANKSPSYDRFTGCLPADSTGFTCERLQQLHLFFYRIFGEICNYPRILSDLSLYGTILLILFTDIYFCYTCREYHD